MHDDDMKADSLPLRAALTFLASAQDAVYIPSLRGTDTTEGTYVEQEVEVLDGRKYMASSSLDVQGFRLVRDCTTVGVESFEMYNAEIESHLKQEAVNLLSNEIPGAKHVEVFDVTRRSSSTERQAALNIRGPSSNVHNDYTAASGVNRLNHYLEHNNVVVEGDANNHGRFCIVNVWRSIGVSPVRNHHLVFCDSTTLDTNDLVSVERQSAQRRGEIQMPLHNSNQVWYYYPNLQPTEVLLIKTFDSETDGRTRFTIHSSFQDPTAPNAVRESLEVRCFVFF